MPDSDILSSGIRGRAVSPKDDFYEYANGDWLRNNPIPDDYPLWGAFSEVQQTNDVILRKILSKPAAKSLDKDDYRYIASSYFTSALDETKIASAGLSPLRTYVDSIGKANRSNLPEIIARLHLAGVRTLFAMGIMPDFDRTNRYLTYFGQGGLGLPERGYYLREDEKSSQVQEAYKTHIAKQLANSGIDELESNKAAKSIFEFEKQLAEISMPAEQLRDTKLTLNRKSVEGLSELLKGFAATEYLSTVGLKIRECNVESVEFFGGINEVLESTDIETIRSYLLWSLLRTFARALPREFEEEHFSFYNRVLNGEAKMKPRWKRAIAWATKDVGDAVARMYVDEMFSEKDKKRLETLVTNLLEQTRVSINSLTWMSAETKRAAIEKLQGFGYKIGYPDKWQTYEKIGISPDSSLLENLLAANINQSKYHLGKIDEEVDDDEWEMPAHVVNAYYNPLRNNIVFPAGILQPPFYDTSASDAVVYGAIGAVIGHEITHGFDDQGSHFDSKGAYRDWWKASDRKKFEKRTDRLVKQYSEYEPIEGLKINGTLTLGENIADLGGLKIAYNALLAAHPKLSKIQKQKFFLSFASIWRVNIREEYLRVMLQVDPHSPGKYRCNGTLANFPEFAQVFDQGGDLKSTKSSKAVEIW